MIVESIVYGKNEKEQTRKTEKKKKKIQQNAQSTEVVRNIREK